MNADSLVSVIEFTEAAVAGLPGVSFVQVDNRGQNMVLIITLKNRNTITFDVSESVRFSQHSSWEQKLKLVLDMCQTG